MKYFRISEFAILYDLSRSAWPSMSTPPIAVNNIAACTTISSAGR